MNIIAHNFNGINIDQLTEGSTIGGKEVPANYVNATQLCKANGKRLANWKRLDRSKAYLEALSSDTQIRVSLLTIEIETEYQLRGTWVHPEVAISIASWISPEFEVWANRTLRLVINGEFKALTADAELAQQELNDRWKKIRAAGKVARRELTDSIKEWLDKNPDRPAKETYSQTTNSIYLALWGMTAVQIEIELGCDRHQLRNHLSEACLRVVERAEDRVVEFIDLEGLEPLNAVSAAQLFPSRVKLASIDS